MSSGESLASLMAAFMTRSAPSPFCAGTVANRDMPGSEVHDRGRNKERRNLAGTALHQFPVFAFDDIETAYAGRNVNAHFVEVGIFRLPIRGLHGKIGASQGHLDKAAHLFQFLFLDPLERIEILDLAGKSAVESRRIELRNRTDPALPSPEVLPRFVRADAQRADQPNTRNHDSASQS